MRLVSGNHPNVLTTRLKVRTASQVDDHPISAAYHTSEKFATWSNNNNNNRWTITTTTIIINLVNISVVGEEGRFVQKAHDG